MRLHTILLAAAVALTTGAHAAFAPAQVPEGVDSAYMTAELYLPPEGVATVRQALLHKFCEGLIS